jgi:Mg2+ and Co2+ transporter CorA
VTTNPASNFNFKSKVKKRLKFTMRNDKSISTKIVQKSAKNNRMNELRDIVSIVGINGINSNVITSHDVGHSERKSFKYYTL